MSWELLANICTILALIAAIWNLREQRREMAHSDHLRALIQISHLLDKQIEHNERVIEGVRAKKGNWATLAKKVNEKHRPAKKAVDAAMIDSLLSHAPRAVDRNELADLLKLP